MENWKMILDELNSNSCLRYDNAGYCADVHNNILMLEEFVNNEEYLLAYQTYLGISETYKGLEPFRSGDEMITDLKSKAENTGKIWHGKDYVKLETTFEVDLIKEKFFKYNGTLLSSSEYKGEHPKYGWRIMNGLFKNYSHEGLLLLKCDYVDGKKHGVEQEWFENGTMHKELNYVNGKLDGIQSYFDDKGVMYLQEEYKDSELVCKRKYIDGKIFSEGLDEDQLNYKETKQGLEQCEFKNGTELTSKVWTEEFFNQSEIE